MHVPSLVSRPLPVFQCYTQKNWEWPGSWGTRLAASSMYQHTSYYLFYTVQKHAHTEDILCVAFDASHLMATASFDGEVCL